MTGRHTVLVPTDFSAGAGRALERALRLPLSPGAKIVLLHVLADGSPQSEAHARAALTKQVASCSPPPGVEIVTELATGEAFAQIISRSRTVDGGLIVIGRHGRRPIRDLLIGSTAERTIRYGDVPVLVVNSETSAPYRRPLVATNLDDSARRVLDLATSVLDPDVQITLVHAFRVPFAGLTYAPPHGAVEQELEAQAREAMDKLVASVSAEHARWRPLIRRGDARAVIASEIVVLDADLVVLGTHGRSGLAHMLVGSVAEWVIAAAACDVLVTRPARFTFELP